MTESYLKSQKVVAHTWSPDGQYIALAIKNTNNVEIYKIVQLEKVNTWQKVWTLKDSSQPINVLSWSIDNKILTGSDDRSVFVYRLINGKWIKDLAICQNDKAIISGEWTQNGQKCGVGTACHRAFIFIYEEKNNWWNNQQIGKFNSSVICCKFHPSGRVIGLGSADQTFQIYTCVVQEKNTPQLQYEDSTYNGVFSNITTFNEEIVKLNMNGWVNALDFNLSGTKFAVASQTGQLKFYNFNADGKIQDEGDKNIVSIKETKPFNKLLFLNDNLLIGVGHDRKPAILNCEQNIKFESFIEKNLASEGEVVKSGGIAAAKQMFSGKGTKPEVDKFGHQTAINCVNKVNDSLISTSDVNGIINFWRI